MGAGLTIADQGSRFAGESTTLSAYAAFPRKARRAARLVTLLMLRYSWIARYPKHRLIR